MPGSVDNSACRREKIADCDEAVAYCDAWKAEGVTAEEWLAANRLTGKLPVELSSVVNYQEMWGMKTYRSWTLAEFIQFFDKRFLHKGVAVDQRFLPRIAEGEVRVICCGKRIVGIVHKVPVPGQIAATQAMGAMYHWYRYDGGFVALAGAPAAPGAWKQLARRLARELEGDAPLFQVLGVRHEQLPAVWTVDFIAADDGHYYGV